MAITAPQLVSGWSDWLTPAQAAPIFERAARVSVVQRLAEKHPLGLTGTNIPIFTGGVEAGWVAEGAKKPATQISHAVKNMTPKKIAAIAVVSMELARLNPVALMAKLKLKMGEAIALAFDKAALYDQGPDGTAGAGPFATYIAQTTKSVELGTASVANGGVRADFISGMGLLANDDKDLTGFALDSRLEHRLLGAVDTTGQPIWRELEVTDVPLTEIQGAARRSTLLARPSWMSKGIYSGTAADVYAVGGDWTQVIWGSIGGVSYSMTDQASVTINGSLVSLWENNLIAVRCEAEFGFLVNDPESFVLYVDAA